MPDEKIPTAMRKYDEQLVIAGVMLAGEGMHPSSGDARMSFKGKNVTVTDGSFAGTKELIAGFWIWNVKSKQDAVDWVKRSPLEDVEIELRQVFENEEFGEEFTPELKAQEERLRTKMAQK